jgi:hypothetical protein
VHEGMTLLHDVHILLNAEVRVAQTALIIKTHRQAPDPLRIPTTGVRCRPGIRGTEPPQRIKPAPLVVPRHGRIHCVSSGRACIQRASHCRTEADAGLHRPPRPTAREGTCTIATCCWCGAPGKHVEWSGGHTRIPEHESCQVLRHMIVEQFKRDCHYIQTFQRNGCDRLAILLLRAPAI